TLEIFMTRWPGPSASIRCSSSTSGVTLRFAVRTQTEWSLGDTVTALTWSGPSGVIDRSGHHLGCAIRGAVAKVRARSHPYILLLHRQRLGWSLLLLKTTGQPGT